MRRCWPDRTLINTHPLVKRLLLDQSRRANRLSELYLTTDGGSFSRWSRQRPHTQADLQGPTSLDVQTSRTRLLQL